MKTGIFAPSWTGSTELSSNSALAQRQHSRSLALMGDRVVAALLAYFRALPLHLPVWLPAALVGYAVCLFAPQLLNDGDTYWHIATGQWILLHHTVPTTDPFSYTFVGAPWVAHEWLSELIMAAAFRLGGWSGVVILFAGVTALAIGLLARHITRWLDPLPAAVVVVIAASCISPSLLARPHVLVLPLIELWTFGLLLARERMFVPWLMLPLIPLWANLHGSFIFAGLLVCPFAVEAVLASGKEWHVSTVQWGLFLAAAIVLASATPQGWHGIVFPIHLLTMQGLSLIVEWQAPNFQVVQPIELAMMAVMYICMSRGVRIPVLRLLVLMGLLHLALQQTRHQMLAGVVGALVLAEPLGRSLSVIPASAQTWGRLRFLVPACSLMLAALLTALRIAYPFEVSDQRNAPVTALRHVPAELAATPVLNDYNFGGYLIFRGLRPFIDGRADMYQDQFLNEYVEIMRPNQTRLLQAIESHNIRWTLLSAGSPIVEILDTLPGWHRLYEDSVAVVHARSTVP
jgi:hypothetical protein